MATQVSHESIEKALDKIDNLSDDALDKMIDSYAEKQEELINYIMQAGAEYENEDLNMYGIYYFAVMYESFLQEGLSPRTISEADIDEFQEPFLEALDAIHKNENHQPLHDLIGQIPLQEFMIAEIEAEDEEGESLSDETKTQLFIVSAAIIGLLNESIS